MEQSQKIASEFGNDFAGFLNYALGPKPFIRREGESWGVAIMALRDKHIFELSLDPDGAGLGFCIKVSHVGGGYSLRCEVIGTNRVAPTQWVLTADHAVMILMSFVGSMPYQAAKKEWAVMPEVQKEMFYTF